MTLYVVQVPDPPVGQDWLTMVPGQYLYDVTGITATLNTATAIGVGEADASGNGRNGTYHNNAPPIFVPGLFPAGGNNALKTSLALPGTERSVLELPTPTLDFFNPWSFECYAQAFTGGGGTILPIQAMTATDITFLASSVQVNALGGIEVRLQGLPPWSAGGAPYFLDLAPHHLAVTWDGANVVIYYDGVVAPLTATSTAGASALTVFLNIAGSVNVPGDFGNIDECAFYDYVPAPTVWAAHVAAGATSFAALEAAILGDLPYSYYHMDGINSGSGRTPGLEITDGTHDVALIGDGFAAVATPGPYTYSWQPKQPSNTQTAGGTLTTVGIPQLILPAGYTIGTRTPDLASTDQWSAVTIWWDDALQNALDLSTDYVFPPGKHYVYQQIGT